MTGRREDFRLIETGGLKLRVAIGSLALLLVVLVSLLVATRDTQPTDDPAGPSIQPSQSVEPVTGLTLEPPQPAPAVLDPATGSAATPRQVHQALKGLVSSPALGGRLGIEVAALGAGAGRTLFEGDTPVVIPASTMKLLTAATALSTLGPDHRFETTVVEGAGARQVVLVGGGDPLLTDRPPGRNDASPYPSEATLSELTRLTVRALRDEGRRTVALGYDESLFTGPAVSPSWEPTYVPESIVSPITALWVDEGRAAEGLSGRVADPALEAARRFAAMLTHAGIKVTGPPRRVVAPSSAAELASVSSAPLDQIVQHMLELSDNEAAEVLLRQAAIATGRAGSFAGGVATLHQVLRRLGVGLSDAEFFDGSGLSRDDRVSVSTLVDVLEVSAGETHPELRPVVSTLPVAGFSGSLDYRFVSDAPRGLGLVRAKTGTLTGVHGLAGLVVTAEGQALVFAAVADRVPLAKTLKARAQLDRIAAALAALPS